MAYSDYSVDFAGGTSQEHVLLGDVLDIEGNTDAFTWVFWAKPDQNTTPTYFIVKMGATPAFQGYGLAFDSSGRLNLYLINDWATNDALQVQSTLAAAIVGQWAFYAVTSDGSGTAAGVTLYRNGYALPTTTVFDGLTGTTVTSESLAFGMRVSDTDHEFDGHLDDILYYTAELTPSEVLALAVDGIPVDPTGLGTWTNNNGFWRMGDGDTFPTLTDSGNGTSHDGTMTNMVAGDIEADAPALLTLGGYVLDPLSLSQSHFLAPLVGGSSWTLGGGGAAVVQKYKMRAQDRDAGLPGYVTWVATGTPDFLGTGYGGGTPTPVGPMIPGSAIVEDEWEE